MPDGHVERREVEEMLVANAFFLPELLKIASDAQTQTLHRGIYDAAVFRAEIKLTGKFAPPDFGALKIDLKDVQWKDAFVTIAASDLRGTREGLVVDWNGTKCSLQPGSQLPGYTTGATALLGLDRPMGEAAEFSIPLDVNGSGGIFFAPFAVQNEAELKSNWPDPGSAAPSCRPNVWSGRMDSMRNGRSHITDATTRRCGRASAATNASTRKRFRPHFSALNSCRFSTPTDLSSARSSTGCSFSSSSSPLSFSLK